MARLTVRDFGTSLKFDGGSSTRVDIGDISALGLYTGSFTITCWVKYTKLTALPQFILSKDASGQRSYAFGIGTTGKIYFERAGAPLTQPPGVVPIGSWAHIAVVFDGSNITYYINGVQSGGTVATTNPPSSTASVNIGRRAFVGSEQAFNGWLDNVSVWNTNLSAQQILDMYTLGTIPTANLVARWLFNEGTGTSTADASGNGYTGTITTAAFSIDVPMKSRLGIRDFTTSLLLPGGSSVSSSLPYDFSANVAGAYAFWFKPTPTASNQTIYNPGCARLDANIEGGAGRLFVWFQDSAAVGHLVCFSPTPVTDGQWHHVVVSKSATRITVYVDGVLAGFFDSTLTTGASSSPLVAGYGSGWKVDNLYTWNRDLTVAEVQGLYYQGTVPLSGLQQGLRFNEGAGLSIADSSGNNKVGTATSLTSFSADVPTKMRSIVNPQLIKNGDFEYAPPFTAATTTNGNWINGTAAGSTTSDLFAWGINNGATAASAMFDTANPFTGTASLKLSTTSTGAFIEVHPYAGSGSVSKYQLYIAPVLPSTSYTLTYRMKTNYTSGDSANGAQCLALERNGAGGAVTSSGGGYIKTTTGWTLYTVTFTTNATTRWIDVEAILYGHTGTATLIMDAWFDDISLMPTTAIARSAAGSRLSA